MVTLGDAAPESIGHATPRTDAHMACDLYVPGHLAHDIQARKAWESDDPVRWGRFEGVDDSSLVVRFLDGTDRYRIHRPAEVEAVAVPGDKVRVSERWRIAGICRRFEPVLTVCIALERDLWRPCSALSGARTSLEDLIDRLGKRGGFSVPGRLAAELVGPDFSGSGEDEQPPHGDLGEVS